jgi:hypothetical protein
MVTTATAVTSAAVKSAATVSTSAVEPATVAIVGSTTPSSATVKEAEPRIWIDESRFAVEIRQWGAAISLKVVVAVGTDILCIRRPQARERSNDHTDGP